MPFAFATRFFPVLEAASLILLLLPVSPVRAEEGTARFVAGLADGSRVEGNQLEGWHLTTPKPLLEGQPLLNPDRPLRWLRDRSKLEHSPEAFVEMFNGDRLPGRVSRFQAGDRPSYEAWSDLLWVEPEAEFLPAREAVRPQIRVVARWIQRIAWVNLGKQRLEPGTVFFRDSSRITFRSVRFASQGITVLVESGTRHIPFDQIAELHLPRQPFWSLYFDQLGLLTSQADTRMLQLQTTDGLIATSSFERADNYARGQAQDPDAWVHGIQPVWSRDALWVPARNISIRRSFARNELPLSLLRPGSWEQRTLVGKTGVEWKRDTSILSSPLRGGEKDFGWGFGVHAYHRLDFPLASLPSRIHTQVALDRAMGGGGCVQSRLLLRTSPLEDPPHAASPKADSRTLAESPVFAGSETVHTLEAALPAQAADAAHQSLSLEVDPAHDNRPQGADPLDIRDVTNWLDPLLTFEPSPLEASLAEHRLRAYRAWRGWEVTVGTTSSAEELGSLSWSHQWNEAEGSPGRVDLLVSTSDAPLTLRRTVAAHPEAQYLMVAASTTTKTPNGSRIVVRLGEETLLDEPVPVRNPRQLEVPPFIVTIPPPSTNSETPRQLEVVQTAAQDKSFVLWSSLRLVASLPMLRTVLEDDPQVEWIAAVSVDEDAVPPANEPPGEGDSPVIVVPAEQAYSGQRAVRLLAGGEYELKLEPATIGASPQWGEFRYLRFAVWKRGGGTAELALVPAGDAVEEAPILRYELGRGGQPSGRRRQLAERAPVPAWKQPLPDKWVAITRDIHADFGPLEITALRIRVPDGEWLMLDHIYLARQNGDLNRPEVAPPH